MRDIRGQSAQTVSSITMVDLSGISAIEEAFALVLAAAALGLFVGVATAERRHEFATMLAIGTPPREVLSFVGVEAAVVLAASFALAAGLGLLLAEMLVAMLQHVFDPPPDHLSVPWAYLGGLAAVAIAGATAATLLAGRSLARMPVGAVLREE